MSLLERLASRHKHRASNENPFIEFFNASSLQEDFPFNLALNALENLLSQCPDDENLLYFCLEDCLFLALLATYNEELLMHAQEVQGAQSAQEMIGQYEIDTPRREQLIKEQAIFHLNYIQNGGFCEGCEQCEHHADVNDLLIPWQEKNLTFFLNLFVGMYSIHFAFEQVIFELLPRAIHHLKFCSRKDINDFRIHVFKTAEIMYQDFSSQE